MHTAAAMSVWKTPSGIHLTAALCLCVPRKTDAEEYPLYVKGIRDLRGHIYAENYSPEIAATRATKVMYMAACLLTGNDYERIEDAAAFAGEKLTVDKLMPLAYLRKVSAKHMLTPKTVV